MQFDLIHEPWLPVLTSNGSVKEVGLAEALEKSDEIRSLAGRNPLEQGALLRLLLTAAHRVVRGPETFGDWVKLFRAGRFSESDSRQYLNKWSERFDLFHPEYPFFQHPELELASKDPKGAAATAKLFAARAVGNNALLFDHGETGSVPLAELARRVVTTQAYALGGGVGATSVQFGKHPNLASGPMVRGLTFFLEGQSLFHTLVLNLVSGDFLAPFADYGTPVWEQETFPTPGHVSADGLLGYYTLRSRYLRLLPDDNGNYTRVLLLQAATVPETFDPAMAYRLTSQGDKLIPVKLDPERSLLRDANAWLPSVQSTTTIRPPATVTQFARFAAREDDAPNSVAYTALGVANDQAKVVTWGHEKFRLPRRLAAEGYLQEVARRSIADAEATHEALRWACRAAAKVYVSPFKNEGNRDESIVASNLSQKVAFWTTIAIAFPRFLASLDDVASADTHHSGWKETLRAKALDVYRLAATGFFDSSARGLAAYAAGESKLRIALAKNLPMEPTV